MLNALRNLAKRSKLLTKLYRSLKAYVLLWKYRSMPRYITLGSYTLNVGEDLGMRSNYNSGDYFESFSTILDQYVRPGDTVVDIGAHVGITSAYLSRHVGPSGRVIAVEPTPDSFRVIQDNIQRNNIKNIDARQVAISSTNGKLTFYTNKLHTGFNSINQSNAELYRTCDMTVQAIEVDSVTFDKFMQDIHTIPRFIKIDCQGAEYEILSEAAGFTHQSRADEVYVYIEFWPKAIANFSNIPATRFLELLAQLNFRIINAEDFFIDIENNESLDNRARQVFVDRVSGLDRGYTNLLMKLPAST